MSRKNIAFPQVLESQDRAGNHHDVLIIYWNHAELYKTATNKVDGGFYTWRDSGEGKFNPFKELEMATGNGFKFVHPARDNLDEITALHCERITELDDQLSKMKEQCPEGGCLIGAD